MQWAKSFLATSGFKLEGTTDKFKTPSVRLWNAFVQRLPFWDVELVASKHFKVAALCRRWGGESQGSCGELNCLFLLVACCSVLEGGIVLLQELPHPGCEVHASRRSGSRRADFGMGGSDDALRS